MKISEQIKKISLDKIIEDNAFENGDLENQKDAYELLTDKSFVVMACNAYINAKNEFNFNAVMNILNSVNTGIREYDSITEMKMRCDELFISCMSSFDNFSEYSESDYYCSYVLSGGFKITVDLYNEFVSIEFIPLSSCDYIKRK